MIGKKKTKQAFDTPESLVAACIRNDRRAQEQLYRQFFPTMMRMCMRYAEDKDEALQIVNDGYLRAFKKIDTYSFQGSLEGWLRRIVFHSLSDFYKKKNRQIRFLELENRDAPIRDVALQNLYLEDVLQLVDRLPDASRDVFVLYAIEGYNHREIGELLNISEGTSKWHLSTARKKLKQLLQRQNNKTNYAG